MEFLWKGAVMLLIGAVTDAVTMADAVDLPVMLVRLERSRMESQRELNFRDRFIEIQLTVQGTVGDLLAQDLPQLWEKLKIKRINKRPMVQTSHPFAAGTGARTTIGAVPVLLMLLHKMAKRPRQVTCHLRTLLRPPSRAVLSNTRLPRHLHHH
uniref:Y-box binding protein 3 n=1 Tax=Myotis myotis TaxID=51298 RepID=A0A7J7ZBZ9_MYOMY|nr:Y-box binding protein 3 [Myotis myotis]